ncbi:MAG: ATP-binding protein [Dehalococcoidia bacterium]|nr:ATP-binding protein [Dehalococcoidia bacterium]
METAGAPLATASFDMLRRALLRLDLRLRIAVEGLRDEIAARAADPLRGLYISDGEIDALLAETPQPWEARKLLELAPAVIPERLQHLAAQWGLDAFEQEAVLIILAPELDIRYERLYGYLQDDVSRRRPTANLVLQLLAPGLADRVEARVRLGLQGSLLASGIVTLAEESAERLPFLSRPLKLDDRVSEFLLGSDRIDGRLTGFASFYRTEPEPPPPALGLNQALVEGLVHLVGAQQTGSASPVVYLHGQTGPARLAAARAACLQAGVSLLVARVSDLLAAGNLARNVHLLVQEATLQDAVLAFDEFDVLFTPDKAGHAQLMSQLHRDLVRRIRPTLLLGEARWEPSTWIASVPSIRLELAPLALEQRLRMWQSVLSGPIGSDGVVELANRYNLDQESIESVAAAGGLRAQFAGEDQAGMSELRAAARAISAPPMNGLARRVEPRHGWDDIVLPGDALAQLREIAARARHQLRVLETWGFGRAVAGRSGLTALFVGQPGTGKTMAAEIIAGVLGLELFRIDLASIVSKYIGETEKNLDAIFGAAEKGDAVLLFDEADALFGKRSEVRDAHDRYANVETAYLLQRLEGYNGVAVLTTNLRGNLDDAFLRRLDFVIEFPMPEEAERLRIWRGSLPNEAPLDGDVDLPFLARKFRLAGGHIRNICLTGAFLAAEEGDRIAMRHLIRGTRREYQKLGKLVAQNDFEPYYSLLLES